MLVIGDFEKKIIVGLDESQIQNELIFDPSFSRMKGIENLLQNFSKFSLN